MSTQQYQVQANGRVFGTYLATDEQEARDLCAIDAGYQSESDMQDQLEQVSELVARFETTTQLEV
jgi:hypothetical protein